MSLKTTYKICLIIENQRMKEKGIEVIGSNLHVNILTKKLTIGGD